MQPVTRHVELFFRMFTHMYISCRRGVVTSVVRRMNEVTLRRARSWMGDRLWATCTVRNQPTRSTQPCILRGR